MVTRTEFAPEAPQILNRSWSLAPNPGTCLAEVPHMLRKAQFRRKDLRENRLPPQR